MTYTYSGSREHKLNCLIKSFRETQTLPEPIKLMHLEYICETEMFSSEDFEEGNENGNYEQNKNW